MPTIPNDFASLYLPDVVGYNEYYPFGMLVPRRHQSGDEYRFGYNGMEKDEEVKGEGNSINYEARMHDPRVGRFLSLDPLAKQFPSLTPYQFASNDPIESIDLDGQERYDYRWVNDDKGKSTLQLISKTDIVDRVVAGYTNGRSFGNDAPVPTYETRLNQRQEFIVHTDHEVYLDNNGGLNMDKPQRKEIFDVRTFYKTKSDMLKGINGRESVSDRLRITSAIHTNAMGPENAALPAMGLGNLGGGKSVSRGLLAVEECAISDFKLGSTFIKGVDNLSGSANIGWYTGETAYFEIEAILKSPNSPGSVFKDLTMKMESIAKNAGMKEVVIDFKMVVNPRLKTDSNWAKEFGYYFSSSTDGATGTTTVTWTKPLK